MATRLVLLVGFVAMAALAACQTPVERRARAEPGPEGTTAAASGGATVNLAPPGEPGERLVMQGRVLDHARAPIAGVEMEVYHADSAGMYAKGPNEPPRLTGRLRTSAEGRYEIHTVVPGSYGYQPHVHVTLRTGRGEPHHFTVDVPLPIPPGQVPRATKPGRIDWMAPPSRGLWRDSSAVLRLDHDFLVAR